jgi:hypothetical protein
VVAVVAVAADVWVMVGLETVPKERSTVCGEVAPVARPVRVRGVEVVAVIAPVELNVKLPVPPATVGVLPVAVTA